VESWRDELINTGYLVKNKEEKVWVDPIIKDDVNTIRFQDELTTKKIDEVVGFVCSLTYDELLLYVYVDDVQKGEGMSENSDVKERIFKERIKIALGMTKRGKVSIAKGAELADMDVMTFRGKLQRMS
jgi:predicted HTH domain antitoxin